MQNGNTIQLASKTESARGLSIKFNNQPSMGKYYYIYGQVLMILTLTQSQIIDSFVSASDVTTCNWNKLYFMIFKIIFHFQIY